MQSGNVVCQYVKVVEFYTETQHRTTLGRVGLSRFVAYNIYAAEAYHISEMRVVKSLIRFAIYARWKCLTVR